MMFSCTRVIVRCIVRCWYARHHEEARERGVYFMSDFTQALLIANIYRYLLICAGVAFAYMGYRLFVLGYFEKSGELKVAFGDHHLLLKQVAPGVFFAALGVLAISIGFLRKIEITVPKTIGISEAQMSDKMDPCQDANENYRGQKGKQPKNGLQLPDAPNKR
jgi:hypothetical protein